LQAGASSTPGGGGGLPYSPGSGGLPDLSSLFGAAMSGGAGGAGTGGGGGTGLGGVGGTGLAGAGGIGLGGLGLGSANFAEMQRQVREEFSQ